MEMEIKQFRSPRGCLSYLLVSSDGSCVMIDPSLEMGVDWYMREIGDRYNLRYIIETHTHADHISCARELRKKYERVLFFMHKKARLQKKSLEVLEISDGEDIGLSDFSLEIIHTPGHTPDSISIFVPEKRILFTGDTLLIGGTGRTDLQGGDSKRLFDSIWRKIILLGPDVIVYPGHDYEGGTSTTIGYEKKTNPRLQLSEAQFIETMNNYRPPLPELYEVAVQKNSSRKTIQKSVL